VNPFEQVSALDRAEDQFRLTRIQTFNWGTFSNVFDFPIPEEGYLFVGPSGSGKSTILDAHAALMTPPKWVDFNVAAREAERHGKDRNVMTYIRGAWAQQTGDSGEYVSQYLRSGTTWSAIAETYRNRQGRCVVLAQVLWVRGNSTAPGDAKRLSLILEREFDLQELEFFAAAEFDTRRFKFDLPDATPYPEFSAYQERFRRLLGIDNERALRLLHKTQSAKNLGDLNVFLRDFMLDAPETFGIAERLVNEFGELNAAHQAVVAAREQRDTLAPARSEHEDLERTGRDRNGLQALQTAVDHYREHRRRGLLDERIAKFSVDLEGSRQEAKRLGDVVRDEFEALTQLQSQKAGMGADILDRLQQEIQAAEDEKPDRIRKRDQAATACKAMGWAVPDSVVWFVQRVDAARQRVLRVGEVNAATEQRKDDVKEELRKAGTDFQSTVAEVKALERQRSNLPAKLLDIRQTMASELAIPEDKLPFVGELLEVKTDASGWQGAIERVMGGFARSILVDDKHYGAVSAYLNERNIGERLAYFRVMQQVAGNRSPGQSSLVRKLNVARGPYSEWLKEELKVHFDLECAETLQTFRAASRAVTREGQVKHNFTRHEKNDRQRIDDGSRWVLGFDNKAKLKLYKDKAIELGGRITELEDALKKVREEESEQQSQLLHCQTLSNLTWSDVDVGSLLTRIDELKKRAEAEKAARPDLARMDELIKVQEDKHLAAVKKKNTEEIKGGGIQRDIDTLQGKLEELGRLFPTADRPPPFKDALDARYADIKREVTLDSLDQVTNQVERAFGVELRTLESRMSDLRNSITQRFAEFNRHWPAEAGGLDPTMESAGDYFGKLQRLVSDGLPQFEARFLALLRDQSDQNMTLLSTKLDQERSAIRARMELVNESLQTAPFNPGTHLVIETTDKSLEEVRQFRAGLKESLSHTFSAEPELAEQRFLVLAALVKRLASQETADKNWRALVLDVRQHVEFVARELDEDNIEVEVYRSGAGKSGGQRQKLAATCLAAALRYQLGGQDRSLPSYSTVVLDEAFDKADSEFTAMAMNIFKTFGFQMIVATPLKSVMTLEPFIGGACFVHIKDRRKSAVIPIDYDAETQRLKLTPDVRHAEEASIS
jgi:uncharacterized protein YPO0396